MRIAGSIRLFLFALLALGLAGLWTSPAQAQDCSVTNTSNGTFIGITSQGGGFGDPSNVEQFLIDNGVSGAERVDKVDGFPGSGGSSCIAGESGNVNAQSTDPMDGVWKSVNDQQICALAIHAGGGQNVAVYVYNSPVFEGGWTTENNLGPQGQAQDISNIQFFTCDDEPPPPQGTVKIIKKTVDGDEVAINVDQNFPVLINGVQVDVLNTNGANPVGEVMTPVLTRPANAQYTVSEDLSNLPSNIQLLSTLCEDSQGVVENPFTLQPDQDVVCTITNQVTEIQGAEFRIQKLLSATNGDPIDGVSFEFAYTNPNGLTNVASNAGFSSPVEIEDLGVDVQITETAQADTTATAISCSDQNGDSVNGNLNEGTVTIPNDLIQSGDVWSCTFENERSDPDAAQFRIAKVLKGAKGDPIDNVQFQFNYTNPEGQILLPSNGGFSSPIDIDSLDSDVTISEVLQENTTVTAIECRAAGKAIIAQNPASGEITIPADDIEADDLWSCSFENVQSGDVTIKVTKLTDLKDATGKFPFKIVNSSRETVRSRIIDTSVNNMATFTVPSESYSVLEVVPEGWKLARKECELNGRPVGEQSPDGVSGIKLGSGDSLECVFVDRREEDPKIKITKLTQPENISGKFPFSIVNSARETVASSTIDTSVTNMVRFTVPTETYSVLETVPEGWQLAEKGCELNGRDVGDQTSNGVSGVKLGFGDELECVFVDRRELGRIVVKKKTIGGNDDFDFILSGTSLSGTSFQLSNGDSREFELVTGSYTIAEDNLPDGWTLKNADCGGVGNQDGDKISVDLDGDETITCTFTNFKEVDDRMEDVVKVFINRRVNNLLDHGPDRARILNRLNQQQPLPSLKDTPPLKYSGTDVSTLTSGTAFGVASGTATLPGIGSSSSVIGQSSSGIGGTASGSLPFGLSGDLSNGIPTGKFAFSLSEMREKAYSKEAAKIANAKSFSGLAFGGNPYGVDYGAIPTTLTPQRQDVWVEGHYSHYNDGTGGISRDGNFGIVYIGTDYSVTDTFLIGALVQFDWTDEDVRDADLTGNVDGWGWMVGPYIGAKLSPNLYFSARAAWGQSSNDINLTDDAAGYRTGSFDTDRWLATAELTGNWYHNGVRITPSAEIAYGTENQDAFRNSLGQRVGSNEATVGQLTFGPEFGFRNVRGDGTVVEPIVSIEGVWTFDDGDLVLSDGTVVGNEELTGRVEAGLLVQRPNGWAYRVTGDYNGIGDGDFESYGVRAWLNIPLN